MTKERKYRDEQWLREQYVELRRSTTTIAKICGCSASTVGRWLENHDIEKRPARRPAPDERLTDPEWLRQQYLDQKKTTTEIADECGCSASAVGRWLERCDIEKRGNQARIADKRLTDTEWLREQYVEQERSSAEIADECGCSGTVVCKWLDKHNIETRSGGRILPDERLTDSKWLREKYIEQKRSTTEIGEDCGCDGTTVSRWLEKHGIEIRSPGSKLPDERLADNEWLHEQYVEKERPTADIAADCGCGKKTVSRWLQKAGIETRRGAPQLPDKRLKDSDWLREQYVSKERTTYQIAEDCGCYNSTISDWLHKHGIETRGVESQIADRRLTESEWLYDQYVEQIQTTEEIAAECGCNASTVAKWLERHNIERRSGGHILLDERFKNEAWLREQYIEKQRSTDDIASECGCSNTTVGSWLHKHGIETRSPKEQIPDERLTDESWLRNQYVEKRSTTYEIADECGCCKTTVRNWLNKHGINTRDGSYRVPSGEDSPHWNGGVFPYGQGWNREKKRTVRERDDHSCQDPRCSVTNAEHLDEYDEKLHVHHLRKAREIDDAEERNAPENLITLCRDCHRRWEKIADAGLVPQGVNHASD